SREKAIDMVMKKDADVVVLLPENFTTSLLNPAGPKTIKAPLELVGDVTQMEYIIGAIWTEEVINGFVLEASGIHMPINWKETTLGFSGQRSMFELYVPGLLILSIIMIIFSASAAIVREPETRTLERLKVSRLTSIEFLGGISLVQVIIAILSLVLALLTAMALGYELIPGTFGFILLISFLTALSMISFSLIVAAMCRSIKEVAIIGTFPLFLLMFFTGAAFPISGGKLFSISGYTVMMNDILSPTWAVDALNKVLVKGQEPRETLTEMLALVVLTFVYLFLGTWAFRKRHMRAA
ncbi:MAG: ABC transporter permease, partial [Bacteroidales bacterium]|nr:ABC transporter permease [Bacteroidales bacterium]